MNAPESKRSKLSVTGKPSEKRSETQRQSLQPMVKGKHMKKSEEATVYVHDLELFGDGANPQRHACSLVVTQALRRTRLFLRVGWWSKTIIDQEWENDSMQYRKLRAHCCPRIKNRFLMLERLHRCRRTRLMASLQVQQYNEVTISTLKHREIEVGQQKQGQRSSIE